MEAANNSSQANDLAVAMTLSDRVISMVIGVSMIVTYEIVGIGPEITRLNRSYILLVTELQKIYKRNSNLSSIKPAPIWKGFDTLKGNFEEIAELFVTEGNESWLRHKDKLERLYILSGENQPVFTLGQKSAIKNAENSFQEVKKLFDEAAKKEKENRANQKYVFQITGYFIKYKPDGTIEINRALKLKRVHAGSITEKLLEQSFNNPNKKFMPNLGKTSRNISTIISSAGFTPVLRALFFPTVSSSGIVFRPYVSREQVAIENIDTEELDSLLKENGAICVVLTEPN